MKRNKMLIFLGLLLFSSLAITAMAYSLESIFEVRGEAALAEKTPACGNCLELKDILDTSRELLVGKIPACGNCLKSKQINVTPAEALIARAAGCSSCGDEGEDES